MSQKSTARTGSDGDVEVKESPNINARSGSSSCKSKRDIFGGPFGDSPYNQVQDSYQDYLLIMFHNDEDTSGTSESSQADNDLYNAPYNYTEQLNLVRKKLNLMELTEESHQRCIITEIVEDEPESFKQNFHVTREPSVSHQRPPSTGKTLNEVNRSKDLELTTIHPFSLNYNLESTSSTNICDPDYSPPSKKVCQRMKTPRFVSVSEGNVPYHTKVGIHDSLFKEEVVPPKKANNLARNVITNFTETRQTQCNEEEFSKLQSVGKKTSPQDTGDRFSVLNLSFETGSDSEYPSSKSKNSGSLFPNVIIETKNGQTKGESTLSSWSSKNLTNTSTSKNALSLNSVRESSDEDEPYKVKVTTIDTAGRKKKTKRKTSKYQEASEKLSMFEEITRLRSGTNDGKNMGDGDAQMTGDPSYDISKINKYVGMLSQNAKLGELAKNSQVDAKSKLDQYIRNYIQYKNEVEKIAMAKKRNRHTVIGQKVVNIQNRIMDSPDKLYQSENSLVSDEEKRGKGSPSTGNSSDSEDKRRFWEKFCFCLCPDRNFND